jgi:hypothetical protein
MNCFCISNDDVYPIQETTDQKITDQKTTDQKTTDQITTEQITTEQPSQPVKHDWPPPPPPIPPTPKNTEHQILMSPIIYNETYIKK